MKKEISLIEQTFIKKFSKNLRVRQCFKALGIRLKTHVEEFDKVE